MSYTEAANDINLLTSTDAHNGTGTHLEMISDWLNVSPSKDFPLFSPSVPSNEVGSLISESTCLPHPSDGAYTPVANSGAAGSPPVSPKHALPQQDFSLPSNGRTIYSVANVLRKCDALHLSSSSMGSSTLETAGSSFEGTSLPPPSFLFKPVTMCQNTPLILTEPPISDDLATPSVVVFPEADNGVDLQFPSFLRTIMNDDIEDYTSPSPTPMSRARYDMSLDRYGLPKLAPPFEFRKDSESPLSSLPSSRLTTPDKPPKRFRKSAITLTSDWRLDKRAYESHRYGTRSKIPTACLAEASVREISSDLEVIRRGTCSEGQNYAEQRSRPSRTNPRKREATETKIGSAPKRARRAVENRAKAKNAASRQVIPSAHTSVITPKVEEETVSIPDDPRDSVTLSTPVSRIARVARGRKLGQDAEDNDTNTTLLVSAQGDIESLPSTPQSNFKLRSAKWSKEHPSPVQAKDNANLSKKIAINPNINLGDSQSIRSFPDGHPINERFPLFYRRFPISSFFDPVGPLAKYVYNRIEQPKRPQGSSNYPQTKSPWNLYQPRFVKGTGNRKEGLCPICRESVERGGSAKNEWFEMKTSAYNYHMQKFHGISPSNGLPFSPPIAFRMKKVSRAQKHQKDSIEEGQCHKCKTWVPMEGPNHGDTKVKELYWWKHACGCHKGSILPGEEDFYYEDKVWKAIKEYDNSQFAFLPPPGAEVEDASPPLSA